MRMPREGASPHIRTTLVDLSVLSGSQKVVPGLDRFGAKLRYMRTGSHPGGRLAVDLGDGPVEIAPGTTIVGPFRGLTASLSPSSIIRGQATLAVIGDPESDIFEDSSAPITAPPVLLSGGLSANVDTAPVIATVNVTGWRKLRCVLDGGASNTITSATVIPWWFIGGTNAFAAGSAFWVQDRTAIEIEDHGNTARYTTFPLDVTPWAIERAAQFVGEPPVVQLGLYQSVGIAFEYRNVVGGATSATMSVWGVE